MCRNGLILARGHWSIYSVLKGIEIEVYHHLYQLAASQFIGSILHRYKLLLLLIFCGHRPIMLFDHPPINPPFWTLHSQDATYRRHCAGLKMLSAASLDKIESFQTKLTQRELSLSDLPDCIVNEVTKFTSAAAAANLSLNRQTAANNKQLTQTKTKTN